MAELSKTGTVIDFETTCRRRDGKSLWISLNARGYTDANGSIVTIDGFCNDMTARKKANEEQNRITDEVREPSGGTHPGTLELYRTIGTEKRPGVTPARDGWPPSGLPEHPRVAPR